MGKLFNKLLIHADCWGIFQFNFSANIGQIQYEAAVICAALKVPYNIFYLILFFLIRRVQTKAKVTVKAAFLKVFCADYIFGKYFGVLVLSAGYFSADINYHTLLKKS